MYYTILNLKPRSETAMQACVNFLKNHFEFNDINVNSNNQIDIDNNFFLMNSEKIRLIIKAFFIGYEIGYDDAEFKYNNFDTSFSYVEQT